MTNSHTVAVETGSGTPRLIFSPIFNVAVRFIDHHVEAGRGNSVAIQTATGQRFTYAQLAEHVNHAGAALLKLGLAPGDRLLMAVKDSPIFLFTFWGAIKAGIIPIAVNTLIAEKDYRFLIEDSECAAVIYSTELTTVMRTAFASAKHRPSICMAAEGKGSLSELMLEVEPSLVAAETDANTECFWLYSSGSTGNPKGVVHEHKDMVATSEFFGRRIAGITEQDVVYSSSKLFFSYGFGGGMTFPLWAGASTVLCDEKTSPDMVVQIIKEFKPTVFFCVPTLYGQLLHKTSATASDLDSIRRAISAGEALPAPVFHEFKERFQIEILDGIGSTEALHIFVSNRPDDIAPGTSGRPLPGYDVKIVDDEGEEVAEGEIGTLWVKGESTARCYWRNPEKTASTMIGKWLNTGDMYHIDEQGYYVNAGRGDDMLKVGGMWCSPLEIESCLLGHEAVLEAAVVGRKDDAGMTKPDAYIVLNDSVEQCDELSSELHDFCKANLAGFKYPRWFNFVDELPKTVTGKIQRYKLRSNQ
jgi:benzoate-CoA ligase family protein